MDLKFAVEPVWSWPTVTLIATGLLGLVLLTYPQRVRHLSKLHRRTLLAARLVAALLLIAAMLRPEIQRTEHDRKSALQFIVGDSSRSMSTKDAGNGMTRRAALVETVAAQEERFKKLAEQIETRRFNFDQELRPVESFDDKANGAMSAFGPMLDGIRKEAQGKRVLGVFLLSDGAARSIAPFDQDPRPIARLMAQQQLPIFPVVIGESALADSSLDVSIEDIVVSPLVFEKNTVPVQATVRLSGVVDRPVTVRLLVEDRSGGSVVAGTMVVPRAVSDARPSTSIKATSTNEVRSVELSFVPDLPGEFKIGVEAVPLADEIKITNNRRETFVTVRRGGVKVAYIDITRPESKYLRTVNQGRQIQLDFHWVRSGAFGRQTVLDPQLFSAGRYDVFIIGDVPAAVFGEAALQQLARRVDDGAALMMMGGFQSFGLGGYAKTPLADVLPVLMTAQDAIARGDLGKGQQYEQDLPMVPTSAGLKHFVMRLGADDNAQRWSRMAPLRGANKLRPKEVAQVLAESPDKIPLLMSLEYGRARVLAFAGDTTYRWASQEESKVDEHQRFWRQVMLWLARKEEDTEQPIWVRVQPRNFAPGSHVPVEFGALDEQGQKLTDVDFKVTVRGPDDQSHTVNPQLSGNQSFGRFTESLAAGTYTVSVVGTRAGKPHGEASTRFLVDARDLELDNPAADPGFLKELAAITGGRVLTREQFGEYFDTLLKTGSPSLDEKRVTREELWDNWWFLSAFVAVMSLEWFLRKRRGLV